MTDAVVQLPTDGTGHKVDVSDLTVGANTVARQRVVLADDATAAALGKVTNAAPGSTDYGLVVRPAGDMLGPTITAASSNAQTLFSQDATGYQRLDFQLAGTFTFTIAIQTSDDNTTWVAAPIYSVLGFFPTSVSATVSAVGQYYAAIRGKYVRAVTTAYTSNTSGVLTAFLRDKPLPMEFINVNANLTNGALPGVITSTGAGGNSLPINPYGFASAAGYTSARIASAASTNLTAVKASAGNLFSVVISNTSAAVKYIKFFNSATTGAVTLGTTAPIWTLMLPATSTTAVDLSMAPLRFSAGITYATVTTAPDSGTTAVGADDLHGFLNYA